MEINSIVVDGVGKFGIRSEVTGLGSGVNILAAGNEAGKSTLFRAVRACERSTHGSSPRMRGTLLRDDGTLWLNRFIPAHAGNTPRDGRTTSANTVHPRACGEHALFAAVAFSIVGSSPRMRGTRKAVSVGVFDCRFSPAHAGNTER